MGVAFATHAICLVCAFMVQVALFSTPFAASAQFTTILAPLIFLAGSASPIRTMIFNEGAELTTQPVHCKVSDGTFANSVTKTETKRAHSQSFKGCTYEVRGRLRCESPFEIPNVYYDACNLPNGRETV